MQRAYILADSLIDDISPIDAANFNVGEDDVITVRIGTPLGEIEQRVTMATLARCGNVKKKAAEILGISLKTLYNRLEGYTQRARDGAERITETV